MSTKRRKISRRGSLQTQLEAFDGLFRWGHDYFHTLSDIGLQQEELSSEEIAAVWRELGPIYMQRWTPERYLKLPWALVKYGDPR
jgi:hypothetical protein